MCIRLGASMSFITELTQGKNVHPYLQERPKPKFALGIMD